jgi:hypothetical protein
MSLHAAAQHLASKGRDEDSLLVHMTPGEVSGLQSLAMAHGGSLTRNPDTGLPEAGFLKNILPTLIGVGANFFLPGIGMAGAAALGAGAGALTNKQDPLMGALMGGIGAYGGAGLGAGLQAAGASAAANAVPAATQTAAGAAAPSSFSLAAPTQLMSATPGPGIAGFATPELMSAPGAFATPGLSTAANASAMPSNLVAQEAAKSRFAEQAVSDRLSQGVGATMNNPSAFMQGMGGASGLIKNAAMAAAPVVMAPPEPFRFEKDGDSGEGYRYRYDAGYTGGTQTPGSDFSSERRYFDPKYARYAEGGGVTRLPRARPDEAPSGMGGVTPLPRARPDEAPSGMSGQNAANYQYLMGQQPGQAPGMSGQNAANYQYLMGQAGQPGQAPGQALGQAPALTLDQMVQQYAPQAAAAAQKATNAQLDTLSQTNAMYTPERHAYLAANPDVLAASKESGVNPYIFASNHYNQYGQREGRADQGLAAILASERAGDSVTRPLYTPSDGDYETPVWELYPSSDYKAGGGLKSGGFVIPADVVSALGNGSSSAGLEILSKKMGAQAFHGPGDGMSDSIPTTIEGKQKARVAREEAYLPPEQVKQAGGTKKLYAMLDRIRTNAHGKTSQQRQINPEKVLKA